MDLRAVMNMQIPLCCYFVREGGRLCPILYILKVQLIFFFSLTHREFEGKGQSSYIPHIRSSHTVFIIINILH